MQAVECSHLLPHCCFVVRCSPLPSLQLSLVPHKAQHVSVKLKGLNQDSGEFPAGRSIFLCDESFECLILDIVGRQQKIFELPKGNNEALA